MPNIKSLIYWTLMTAGNGKKLLCHHLQMMWSRKERYGGSIDQKASKQVASYQIGCNKFYTIVMVEFSHLKSI